MEAGNRSDTTQRIALLIQYNGTAYNGWQVQNGGRTIQSEIERAIKTLTRESVRLTASGRTDAGVHALGQVAHFDLKGGVPLGRMCISLNGILERDISILNAYRASQDFHARFSARSREYLYFIYNSRSRSPFMMHRAMWVNRPLDLKYLREAAEYLIGEMDYSSFCKKISKDENMVRRVESIEIDRIDDLIRMRIRGNAFLHNMIRIIVGTLCGMHKEGLDPSHMKTIIEKRDRSFAGETAPPYGLFLREVRYHPPLSSLESAF
jgi:tRNA pseudouridine38-40 synthase